MASVSSTAKRRDAEIAEGPSDWWRDVKKTALTVLVTAVISGVGSWMLFVTLGLMRRDADNATKQQTENDVAAIRAGAGQATAWAVVRAEEDGKAKASLAEIQKAEKEAIKYLAALKLMASNAQAEIISGIVKDEVFLANLIKEIRSKPQAILGKMEELEPNTQHTAETDGFVTVFISGHETARGYAVVAGDKMLGVMFDPVGTTEKGKTSVQAPGTFVVPKGSNWSVISIDKHYHKGEKVEPGAIVVQWTPITLAPM